MDRVLFLLPLLCVGVASSQPITECQRLFSIAVSRAQHLHLLAQKLLSDFQEISLQAEEQTEEQRQLNKIFLQDSDCKSDYIISPINKHETQRSSVLKLLSVSYHLLDSWELPSRSLPGALRTQISDKLSQLKAGIRLLFKANQGAAEVLTEGSAPLLDDYRNYYPSAESLACFKKDMHKVETYLTVGKCRLSPEANCTL